MEALQVQLGPLIRLATVILTVAMLYWAREFFIPLALAILFAFLMKPVVSFFNHKLRFPRSLAVIAVTLLSFSVLGAIIYMLGVELHALGKELPSYRYSIHHRVAAFKEMSEGSVIDRLQTLVQDVSGEPNSEAVEKVSQSVEKPANRLQEGMMSFISALADSLGTAGVVIVFVIFMLLRQQDVRNRVIQLVGYSRLTTTTRALDEAASRVSRYLLMQTVVNGVYGVLLALGFWAIGLPYVILWGSLAALFRFVPYVGPWIAAILPGALSLVVFDGWSQPLMVLALIVSLELMTNMILEPLLYGQSAGVSDLALLIAIVFWTWLWGPVGLLLATPLTVCVVVFSKYIPNLHVLEVLMGEHSEVQPSLLVYQRLLVGDVEEAEAFIEEQERKLKKEGVIDAVLLPAAVHARRETLAGRLSQAESTTILEMLSDLADIEQVELEPHDEDESDTPLILCRSFDASADALPLKWMAHTLAPDHIRWDSIPPSALVSEVLAQVESTKPEIVCISAMPPGVSSTAQLLCKRLRHRFPELKILLARWGAHRAETTGDTGASWVVTTTAEARERLVHALHLDIKPESPAPAAPKK